jgi:hypothetical protein
MIKPDDITAKVQGYEPEYVKKVIKAFSWAIAHHMRLFDIVEIKNVFTLRPRPNYIEKFLNDESRLERMQELYPEDDVKSLLEYGANLVITKKDEYRIKKRIENSSDDSDQ